MLAGMLYSVFIISHTQGLFHHQEDGGREHEDCDAQKSGSDTDDQSDDTDDGSGANKGSFGSSSVVNWHDEDDGRDDMKWGVALGSSQTWPPHLCRCLAES